MQSKAKTGIKTKVAPSTVARTSLKNKVTSSAKAPTAPPANTLQIEGSLDPAKRQQLLANVTAEGLVTNVVLMKGFSTPMIGEVGLTESVKAIRTTLDDVSAGSTQPSEVVLYSQAQALNAIFAEMARRASLNMGQHIDAFETYMRLALKAQGQCRATLETLAAIKNPPVVFAKQANIAHGHQQVNNGTGVVSSTPVRAHAGESAIQQNELLADQRDGSTYMDSGTTPAAARGDSTVATVAASNRTQKRGGKSRDES